jgi:putative oxidoreductase
MSIYEAAPRAWRERMLAVFRIVAGVVFISLGTMKLFGWPPAAPPGVVPVPWASQAGVGGFMETIGGVLIVVGLFTRPVAFVLAGEMAVAYWQFHFPVSPYPTMNMGTPAIMYCFFFLYLVAAGPGAWSVDGAIARGRRPRAEPGLRPEAA